MARRSKAQSDRVLAEDVLKLFMLAISGDLKATSGDESPEVRQVAFGLAVLQKLVDREISNAPPFAAAPMGLFEAAMILDAVTSGREHPIWQFLSGMRSRRPNRAQANAIDQKRHEAVVAFARAIADVGAMKMSPAIRLALKQLNRKDVTFEMVRTWHKRTTRDPHKFPSLYKNHLIDIANTMSSVSEEQPSEEQPSPLDILLFKGGALLRSSWAVPP
jgi:hypothetical protein